jgi:PleD family two-component response regulator
MVADRLIRSFNKVSAPSTSLSIGLAKLERSGETLKENLESLLRRADQAVYCAKINGGNQVCIGPDESETASSSLVSL